MAQAITLSTLLKAEKQRREAAQKAEFKSKSNATATCMHYLFFLFLVLLMANKTRKDRRMKWDEREENTWIFKSVSNSRGENNEWQERKVSRAKLMEYVGYTAGIYSMSNSNGYCSESRQYSSWRNLQCWWTLPTYCDIVCGWFDVEDTGF